MSPPRLYRYRPLGTHAAREIAALRNAFLWSPRFSEMNDPMEAFYELGSPEDGLIDAMLKPAGKSTTEIYGMARTTIDGFCLVSFSSGPSDLPLWAYYGDNFAGLCLEFDTNRLMAGDFRGAPLIQVEYAEEPLPSIPFHQVASQDAVVQRLGRKRIEWAHEKEWRILTAQSGPQRYLDEALLRIHLGPRIDAAHAEEIRTIFRNRPTEIVQGRIDSFDLSFPVLQSAAAAADCERVGTVRLNLDEVIHDRAAISDFLDVPIEQFETELRRLAAQPNVVAITDCDLSATRAAIYLYVDHRLRDGHVVQERIYYDARLNRLD